MADSPRSPSPSPVPSWTELAQQLGQPLSQQGQGLPEGWYFPAAPGVSMRGSLVCLHGIQTHADWFAPLARELNARGYALYCPDRKYSGSHPGNNGIARIESSQIWIDEVKAVIAAARRHREPVYLLGTSWGAKVALGVLADDPHQVAGTVMLVPALKTTKETPGEMLKVFLCLPLNLPVKLPLDERDYVARPASETAPLPTADQEFIAEMKSDKKLLHKATPWFQLKALFLQKRSLKKLKKHPNQPPMLALYAEGDNIVDQAVTDEKLVAACPKRTRAVLPSAGHGVQILNPAVIARQIDAWARHLPRTP